MGIPRKILVECIGTRSNFIEAYLTWEPVEGNVRLYFDARKPVTIPLIDRDLTATLAVVRRKFESKGYILKVCGACAGFNAFSCRRLEDPDWEAAGTFQPTGIPILDSCDGFEQDASSVRAAARPHPAPVRPSLSTEGAEAPGPAHEERDSRNRTSIMSAWLGPRPQAGSPRPAAL